MLLRVTSALVLLATACVEDPEITVAEPEPDTDGPSVFAQVDGGAPVEPGQQTPEDICGLLPCDGPCSLACDSEALIAEYVPSGTCVVFSCTLTDGRSIGVHACDAAD